MKQWWEKTTLGAFAKLHSFHIKQRRKMIDQIDSCRAENHILLEINESFAEELFWYENVVGAKLTDEIDNFLQRQNTLVNTNKTLHESLVALAEVEGPQRLNAIRKTGVRLGMLCADEKLCPLTTAIMLYRFGSANSDIDQERITEAAVSGLQAGMRGETV